MFTHPHDSAQASLSPGTPLLSCATCPPASKTFQQKKSYYPNLSPTQKAHTPTCPCRPPPPNIPNTVVCLGVTCCITFTGFFLSFAQFPLSTYSLVLFSPSSFSLSLSPLRDLSAFPFSCFFCSFVCYCHHSKHYLFSFEFYLIFLHSYL
ncbi:hypothetical protein E2C01_051143 [Portunus trituberculatus]|uniref:Uncharacterized protein n=1 Tax=Portunus trituberculatus TaxID=210409 RepID=A0A5B7GJD8_PORTR|nr:hypothetical protein [Portunus trituberculatus]